METLIQSARRLWCLPATHCFSGDRRLQRDIGTALHYADGRRGGAYVPERWSPTPFQPNILLRTSSIEAVRSLVANGQGVAILSDMVHRPWSLEGRRIETINVRDKVPSMDVGLAWRRAPEFSPQMRAFRSYFRQAFQIPDA